MHGYLAEWVISFLLDVLHVVIKTEKEYLVIYCGIMATTTHVQPITRSNIFV